MNKFVLFSLGMILCSSPAWAGDNTADVDKVTCKQMMAGADDDRGATLAFYQGYRSGKAGKNTIDLEAMGSLSNAVSDYCLSNPTSTVAQAFEKSAK